MVWGSTHKTKLHKIRLKQKHPICLVCNENKFTHTKRTLIRILMQSLQVLNVFQITIQKITVFMPRVKTCSDVPSIFANRFCHRYPTIFSKNNVALPKYTFFSDEKFL